MAGWIERINGANSGPISAAVLKQMAVAGEIDPSTMVRRPYSPRKISKAIGEHHSGSGKRRYRMIEIYAMVFRVLGIVVAVCGVLAALLTITLNPPSLLDAIVLGLGMIVGSALIAFSLLLSSQMIKLVLDVAGDIKQIADRSQ